MFSETIKKIDKTLKIEEIDSSSTIDKANLIAGYQAMSQDRELAEFSDFLLTESLAKT